jgi:hypothetical protein
VIKLRWAPFPGADVVKYRVFRSIIGFSFTKPELSSINGTTLQLKMNCGALQTVVFNGTDPIINQISLTGGHAYNSADDTEVIIRSDIREAPGSVEIIGGTILPLINQLPRLITEKSEDSLLAEIDALEDETAVVELEDPDGAIQDYYAITTINSVGDESVKSPYKQAIQCTGPVCIVEGIVYDLQGVRVPDAEVIATIQVPPDHAGSSSLGNVTKEPIKTYTGSDGRFSLPLLQNALVEFKIPATGFESMIRIPEAAYAFLNDIPVDLDYRYPLGYR